MPLVVNGRLPPLQEVARLTNHNKVGLANFPSPVYLVKVAIVERIVFSYDTQGFHLGHLPFVSYYFLSLEKPPLAFWVKFLFKVTGHLDRAKTGLMQ